MACCSVVQMNAAQHKGLVRNERCISCFHWRECVDQIVLKCLSINANLIFNLGAGFRTGVYVNASEVHVWIIYIYILRLRSVCSINAM